MLIVAFPLRRHLLAVFPGLLVCYYSGAEDDVPRARDIQLPPERMGEDRADCEPIH